MGFFDFFKSSSKKPSIDLKDFKFISDNHTRILNGQKSNTNNKGAWRGVRIQSFDNFIFSVTIYNLAGTHPVWGDNIQMSPKQMKFIEENNEKISLRGFSTEQAGASFADYGLTLHKLNNIIELVTLHMYDRNINIIYSRGNPNDMNKSVEITKPVETLKVVETPKNVEVKLDQDILFIKQFKEKWDTNVSIQDKMIIATQSDELNNAGCDNYEDGNIEKAIEYFIKALQIMPINDDALLNLARSYNRNGKYRDAIEPLKKLFYLKSDSDLVKSQVIAYSLLLHIIEDFDSDGGSVYSSKLASFIGLNFYFTANDNEIKRVIRKINNSYNRAIIVYFIGGGFGLGSLGSSDNSYMSAEDVTLSMLREEIKDVLNWH